MALHFLVEDLAADAGAGDDVEITGTEAHHAAVVRRVRIGETVTVTVSGTELPAVLVAVTVKLSVVLASRVPASWRAAVVGV